MQELIGVALRVSFMYVFALALVRLAGKRSIGNLSPLDFLVTLIIGDMFDDLFWAEIPLSQAVVGMGTVIGLHILISYIAYKSRILDRVVNSTPTQVVRDGHILQDGLRHVRLSPEELDSDLRLQGEDTPGEVKSACLEPSGEMSLIKKELARTVQKRDRSRLLELYK